jgi:hypothetical protein
MTRGESANVKAEDAKTYAEVRSALTAHRLDLSKLHLRVSSGKVYLSGELHKIGGPSVRPLKLFVMTTKCR